MRGEQQTLALSSFPLSLYTSAVPTYHGATQWSLRLLFDHTFLHVKESFNL